MTRNAASRIAASGCLLAMLAACAGDEADDAAPVKTSPLTIVSPVSGVSMKGNVVTLDLDSKEVSIVKADGDTSGRTGHYHVFIDREPVAPGVAIPREAGIVHSADDPVMITGLSPGSHRLVVVYGNGAHVRIGDALAETTVKIDGPSVKASAPATAVAGQPVTVTAKVEGFSLIKADGDTSGRTGHLHLFVDKSPTAPGQPIPAGDPKIIHTAETTVAVPDLGPGEHTIWVVAGDGIHTPLAPSVMDKVTVTVTGT